MEDELTGRLSEAYQGILRLKKIGSMLYDLHQQKQELEAAIASYKTMCVKETADVQKLEKGGVSALFYSALGTLDKRLDKERAEELAARLKLEQAQNEAAETQKRIDELSQERGQLSWCEKEYAMLYEQKIQVLLDAHGSASNRILSLTESINRAAADIKEIAEALAAGEDAAYHFERAKESLGKAENWGVYDMLCGGFIATAIKHERIDEAADEAACAQTALNCFRTELADVHVESNINIGFTEFSRFADFFFDGLIADWYAQGQIEDSLESVTSAAYDVSVQLSRLKKLEAQEQSRIKGMQRELDALIMGTSL